MASSTHRGGWSAWGHTSCFSSSGNLDSRLVSLFMSTHWLEEEGEEEGEEMRGGWGGGRQGEGGEERESV